MNEIIKNTDLLIKKEYLTIKETTEVLGVHENTLYNIFKRGHMKPVKYMRKNYLKSKDIIEYTYDRFGRDVVFSWLNLPVDELGKENI